MGKILVSGLVNCETTVNVHKFPIEYFPIDYPFFGISSNISGVAFNIISALKALGDDVTLISFTGKDLIAEQINSKLKDLSVSDEYISRTLKATPSSVVLYDDDGRRQIYCDLKDIKEKSYECTDMSIFDECSVAVICNINFNRNLLKKAKEKGITVASDVHVLSNINDDYNKDFMAYSDILFMSDEKIPEKPVDFLKKISDKYGNKIIVLGQGSKGVLMYVTEEQKFYDLPCVKNDNIINTVGAGDSLFSAFIHCFNKGLTPLQCLEKAQIFASYKIGFNGASVGFMTENQLETSYLEKY